MRVSESLIFDTATLNTDSASQAAQQAQEIASTGVSVAQPGDNPVAAGLMVTFNMSSNRFAAISSASSAASSELGTANDALNGISSALSQAKQLAIEFGSSGYSQAQAAGAAQQVQGLFNQVISDLNTTYGNRYIFGGTQDGSAPFDPSGAYQGNYSARNVEMAPGVFQQANVLVGSMGTNSSPQSVLSTLQALSTALSTNYSPSTVQTALNGLDTGIAQVSTTLSQVGVYVNTFNAASSAASTASTNATTQAGQEGDADIINASIKLQTTQTALQASLAATAQSFKLSLLNYL